MLDVTQTLTLDFQNRLADAYRAQYGDNDPQYLDIIEEAATLSIGKIATSNASYHNVEHTLYVTAAGQSILTGKRLESDVSSLEWTHVTLATLFHDIGFIRGLCKRDIDDSYYSGVGENMIQLQRGNTDASMMPYHVDRGQAYVTETYKKYDFLDIEFICNCIERTRFPIPADEEHANTLDFAGLVRAADLIGQFADPRYLNKLNALFQEFDEQGINERVGYTTLEDMYIGYPQFFENQVLPYIGEGIRLLELTEEGREIVASMNKNLQTARDLNARL